MAVSISLRQAESERTKLEAEVAALRKEVTEKGRVLQGVEKRNEILARNPNLIYSLRQQILRTIAEYRARWERETQLGNERNQAGDSLQNSGRSGIDSNTSIGAIGGIIGAVGSGKFYVQARHNFTCAAAATRRINELSVILKDPVAATNDLENPDFTLVTHSVTNGKRSGELMTSAKRIEYHDVITGKGKPVTTGDGSTIRLACSDLKTVAAGGPPVYRSVKDAAGSKSLTIKSTRGNLSLKVGSSDDQQALMGDIFLACPVLTGGWVNANSVALPSEAAYPAATAPGGSLPVSAGPRWGESTIELQAFSSSLRQVLNAAEEKQPFESLKRGQPVMLVSANQDPYSSWAAAVDLVGTVGCMIVQGPQGTTETNWAKRQPVYSCLARTSPDISERGFKQVTALVSSATGWAMSNEGAKGMFLATVKFSSGFGGTSIQTALTPDNAVSVTVSLDENAGPRSGDNAEGIRSTGGATASDPGIQYGRYSQLPPPQRTVDRSLGPTTVRYVVENRTAYELHLRLTGPVSWETRLLPGAAQTQLLPAGAYTVQGEVVSSSILPFYGPQTYTGGAEYRSAFYIAPQ